ncbi:tryptophanase [Fusarium phyllophilum]|uniref:Tryptophanase n=1 Tax=Fusarium phyllophilum TaxID=47803 RepID=A0A8H5JAS7_9HYPO|nr:tryptophanase [Fusarium phyllophilum]
MSQVMSMPAFTVASVRQTEQVPRDVRERILRSVQYNVFAFPAALVVADFLSDSGTASMTSNQWSAIMQDDESYGRNSGYYYLLEALRDIFERGEHRLNAFQEIRPDLNSNTAFERFLDYQEGGFVNGGLAQMTRPNCFLVPQGRCAESLLFQTTANALSKPNGHQPIIISNGFFDTTSANASSAGFSLLTFAQEGWMHSEPSQDWRNKNPFKGNMDISAAEELLSNSDQQHHVALIVLTITNNHAAGQPVSMENIREVSRLSKNFNIPLIFDACRFAENAMSIKRHERAYKDSSIPEIIREMFSEADGFTISLKKDGLANMGGVLCLRDDGKYTNKYPSIGIAIREEQILRYGNDSYGGMSGRDLMAATVGLYEGTKESYLSSRLDQVHRFAEKLAEANLPVLLPPGSAVFLDMDVFFKDCNREYEDFAALGFTLELLGSYGIRAFELGPFASEWDSLEEKDKVRTVTPNLVRFSIPRNAMTDQHLDYTVTAVKELMDRRHTIQGVRITHGKNLRLRHFQAALEPIPINTTT